MIAQLSQQYRNTTYTYTQLVSKLMQDEELMTLSFYSSKHLLCFSPNSYR